jgi:deoxyhypusine synthase
MIDRIYDTYIDEDDLRACDDATHEIFNAFEPGAYSSREFIEAMGAYLANNPKHAKNESIVKTCYQKRVPIFVPAFSDCSAGFGIVLQQTEAIEEAAARSPSTPARTSAN